MQFIHPEILFSNIVIRRWDYHYRAVHSLCHFKYRNQFGHSGHQFRALIMLFRCSCFYFKTTKMEKVNSVFFYYECNIDHLIHACQHVFFICVSWIELPFFDVIFQMMGTKFHTRFSQGIYSYSTFDYLSPSYTYFYFYYIYISLYLLTWLNTSADKWSFTTNYPPIRLLLPYSVRTYHFIMFISLLSSSWQMKTL